MSASTLNTESLVVDFSRFYILTILYEGPQHGYRILSTFKERTGKVISPSLVYPFLCQLEKKGYVTHSLKTVGAKKKKVFELTTEGLELCRVLFKRFSVLVSVAIEPTLTICTNCGCKIYGGGYKENLNEKEHAFCCVHCAQSYTAELLNNQKTFKKDSKNVFGIESKSFR
ncbi:PadR family transcriptional regulator [Candidatus Bathyarchaeota archaeon]|nr:MAG: PadR family transcriptional regulator [Candidatus Bathyarchaeota archaeon]